MTKISHPTLSKIRSLQLSCPYNNQARPLDDADERERERERERRTIAFRFFGERVDGLVHGAFSLEFRLNIFG